MQRWLNGIKWLLVATLVVMACYGIWVGVDQKIASASIYELGVLPVQVELSVGESMQLKPAGYRRDGSLVDTNVVEKVDYHWEAWFEGEDAFALDKTTGIVTALTPGQGTVYLTEKDRNMGSPYFCTITIVE